MGSTGSAVGKAKQTWRQTDIDPLRRKGRPPSAAERKIICCHLLRVYIGTQRELVIPLAMFFWMGMSMFLLSLLYCCRSKNRLGSFFLGVFSLVVGGSHPPCRNDQPTLNGQVSRKNESLVVMFGSRSISGSGGLRSEEFHIFFLPCFYFGAMVNT